MVQFTLEERVFVVECYILTRSPNEVIRQFRGRFSHRNTPTKVTVLSNYEKYHLSGTSCNRNKGNSGRRHTTRTAGNVQRVRETLETDPTVSARRILSGLPTSCFNEITQLDLRWHPYMIQVNHQLLSGDFQRRINFCTWFLERPEAFLKFLATEDEAAFQMNKTVTTRNVRCYAPKHHLPLEHAFSKSMSREKLSVWIGLCGNGKLIGPFIFEGNVNDETYLQMLNDQIVRALAERYVLQENGTFLRVRWAQDGALAHRRAMVMEHLQQQFLHRKISLGCDHKWQPRSPDLTPLDFLSGVTSTAKCSSLRLLTSQTCVKGS